MRDLTMVLSLALAPIAGARAQWHVGLELGTTHYGGSSHDTAGTGGPETFRPGDATSVGLRVTRQFGRGRTAGAIRISYAKPGLAAAAPGIVAADKSSGELIEVTGLVAVHVAGVGSSGAVRAELGPALHLWNLGGERARIGALAALAYEWPVSGRFTGAIRFEGAASRSWFDAGEPPPEYDLRTTWRYGVTLGLGYRL
jgi:hypothetical protein